MRPCVPMVFGSGGPAVRSKDSRWRRGIGGPGPPLQSCSVAREVRVELAGDVTLQDAHDLASCETFTDTAGDVFAGAFVAASVVARVAGAGLAAAGLADAEVFGLNKSPNVDLPGRCRRGGTCCRTRCCLSLRFFATALFRW